MTELQVKKTQAVISTYERRAKRSFGAVLKKQARFLSAKMEDMLNTKSSTLFIYKKDLESDINLALTQSGLKEELTEEVIRYMGLSLVAGNKALVMSLKQPTSFLFTLKDPRVAQILKSRKEYELSNAQGNLASTTKRRVAELVAQIVLDGGSIDDVKKGIMEQVQVGVFSQARAELIAITEIGKAFGEAQAMTARDIGGSTGRQIMKRWITVKDEKVRADHSANEAQGWIDMNERFQGTGDEIAPSSDYRCRCTMAHTFADSIR